MPSDFTEMIGKFDDGNAAYELNLSCPHVAKVGLEVGDDPELVRLPQLQRLHLACLY